MCSSDLRVATVLMLPEGDSTEPIMMLLRSLSQQHLIERVWVMRHDRQSLAVLEPAGEETEISQSELLQMPFDRFCLVNLVTADCSDVAGHFARAEAVGEAFERALAVGLDGQGVQQLTMLNLVAPCAADASMPSAAFTFGSDTAIGWTNVVLVAEVQSDSTSAGAMVEPDEGYVANTVSGLLSLTGLWVSASIPELPYNSETDRWHLARTRMRMLAAPELAQRVMNRAARRDPPLPQDVNRSYKALEGKALNDMVDLVAEQLAEKHHLRAVMPPLDPPSGSQRTPGLRKLLQLVVDWLRRRLPQLVVGEIRDAGRSLVEWIETRVNGAFSTEDLEFRFSFLGSGTVANPSAGHAGPRTHQRLLVPLTSPEPELWENLRASIFGLMDGSTLPFDLEDAIASPATRFVVCARTRLVPAPNEPVIQSADEQGRSVEIGRAHV